MKLLFSYREFRVAVHLKREKCACRRAPINLPMLTALQGPHAKQTLLMYEEKIIKKFWQMADKICIAVKNLLHGDYKRYDLR